MSRRIIGIAVFAIATFLAAVSPGIGAGSHGAKPTTVFRAHAPLTEGEMAMAQAAWQYFVAAYQPDTGLVNSVLSYPSTTLWDTASYVSALVSARELGIIDKPEFDRRAYKLLGTLRKLPLFRGELPNKVYNTKTAEKVDYANKPGEVGYSALDVGRMMIWLRILKERNPYLANSVDGVLLRWNYCHIVSGGQLYGAAVAADGKTNYFQEGRLGYEEYAAKGFALWGFYTQPSYDRPQFEYADIFDLRIPYDARDPRLFHTSNYVLTESYLLDGLELGWDMPGDSGSGPVSSHPWRVEFANRIYLAQARRYARTGIVTARSEHQVDGAPFFVYDSVFADGYPWNTTSPSGDYVPERAAVATKAAIGMWAIWDTPYSDVLFATVGSLYDPKSGFDEGVYETGGNIPVQTANNNGIILAALLYKAIGPIMVYKLADPLLWNTAFTVGDARSARCLPVTPPTPAVPCKCGQAPAPPPVLKPEDYILCKLETFGGSTGVRRCSFDVGIAEHSAFAGPTTGRKAQVPLPRPRPQPGPLT